jgi:hypothetical protein
MAVLFGRTISLTIAPESGASPAVVARIKAASKAASQMFATRDEAFARMGRIDYVPGSANGNLVVWKFSESQWGIITSREAGLLQGPPTVEGKEFKDLRVSFKIKKTSDGKPNEATIQLFNPNPDTISSVQDRKVIVRLFAGYDFPWMLFQGNPIKDGINISREGPTRVLKMELLDGRRALATELDLNLSKNTTLKQALTAIAKASNMGVGFVADVEDFDLPYGMHLDGSPAEALERIGTMSDADFSIQDGAIQIVKGGNDTGEPAVLFSTKNGNLLKVARKEKGRVDVTAMLEGSIRPGRRFVVESEYINGIFKAIDVEHIGDIFEDAFTTRITARPWKAPSPAAGKGTVASIKAASKALYGLFPNLPAAQGRASKIDLKYAVEAGNLFIARFSETEYGLIARNDVSKLRAKGLQVYETNFVGPVQ